MQELKPRKGLYQYSVALDMHCYLFHSEVEHLAVKLKLKNDQNYSRCLNRQFTNSDSSEFIFSTVDFVLILCPRKCAS